MIRPKNSTWPFVGSYRRSKRFTSVLFPLPLRPTYAKPIRKKEVIFLAIVQATNELNRLEDISYNCNHFTRMNCKAYMLHYRHLLKTATH